MATPERAGQGGPAFAPGPADIPAGGARAAPGGAAPACDPPLSPGRGRRARTTAVDVRLQVLLEQRGRPLRRATALAATAYALLALLSWWPVDPVSTSHIPLCGCFDPAQLAWSLGWTPYAILHGLNPFFTTYVDWPVGANMAANPAMPLLGLLGMPVTLLLGPVATLNLLFRAAFALSALAMFLALRRFVASQAAAFLGGLLYGFSPAMVAQDAYHLSISFLVIPPLVLGVLHDLVVAPRISPWRHGCKLGLLCAAEYLISPEVLADLGLLAALGLAAALVGGPAAALRRARFTLRGIAAALGVFAAICAYPLWFQLDGPGHLSGTAPFGLMLSNGTDLLAPIVPTTNELLAPASLAAKGSSFLGGNLVENGGYLGVGLIAVLLATLVALRRDPVVRFCWVMLAVAFVCSLGTHLTVDNRVTSIELPLGLVATLPGFSSELAARYSSFVDLFAAVLLAVALDRLARGRDGTWRRGWRRRSPRALAFAGCAAFALLPLVPSLPYHEVPTGVPTAFFGSAIGRQIPRGSVVLSYPYDEPPRTQALLWAATQGYRFKLIGGYYAWPAPQDRGDPFPPPPLQPAEMVQLLDAAESGDTASAPLFDRETIAELRAYVRRWRVAALVFQVAGVDPRFALPYLDTAFGAPRHDGGVYLWRFRVAPGPPPPWDSGAG